MSGRRSATAIAVFFFVLALVSCGVKRVPVPTPAQDSPPVITLTAVPTPDGDVEPGKQHVSTTTDVKVSRGMVLMFMGNAKNAGGVKSLSIDVAQSGITLYQPRITGDQDAQGNALDALVIPGAGPNLNQAMKVTMNAPAVVSAIAWNFNNQFNKIQATYVPTDLTVAITASPSQIGYQLPATSTLSWSVLYGAGPIKFGIVPSLNIQQMQSIGTATVSPQTSTTYLLTASDSKTTQSASAFVGVVPPPPPPSITKFSAAPNNGYNCLGMADTIGWSVGNCSPANCNITLTGKGYGYAKNVQISVSHLQTNGQYTINPGDQVDFTLAASSLFGSVSKSLSLTIAPPNVCLNSQQPAMLMPFYFAVTGPNGFCNTIEVVADNEQNAEKNALAFYGNGYSVKQITADDFVNGRGC